MNIERIFQILRLLERGNVLTLRQSSISHGLEGNIFTVQEHGIFQSCTPALFLNTEDGAES